MVEKTDSVYTTYEEEDFEFAPVQQTDDGRYVSNCKNHSHEDPNNHIYPVYFGVEQDGTGVTVRAVECGGPSDQYHSGPCKHRQAAGECAELLAAVLERALADEDDSIEAAHATPDGAVATDGGQVEHEPTRIERGQRWEDASGTEWEIVIHDDVFEIDGTEQRRTWLAKANAPAGTWEWVAPEAIEETYSFVGVADR